MRSTDLGRHAQEIIDNPAFRESFDRLEREIIRRLAECPLDGSDDKYRDKLHMMLKLHYMHRQIFSTMVSSGKLEDASLKRKTLTNRIGL